MSAKAKNRPSESRDRKNIEQFFWEAWSGSSRIAVLMKCLQMAAISLAALLLAACEKPPDARFSPGAPKEVASVVTPPDAVIPKNRAGVVDGLYTILSNADPTDTCCWLAPHAVLHVEKRTVSRELRINTYLPPALLEEGAQQLTIRFIGYRGRWTITPGQAFAVSAVPVPSRLRNKIGIITVAIDAKRAYAPPDGNRYSLVLNSIYFQ